MRSIQAAACIGMAALLAACATTDSDHFYTLNGPATPAPTAQAAAQPVYIEMLAVNVPAQVKRKELVVTTGAGQVDMLDHHRWIGPLADEIGHALSLQVSAELGAIDVYRTPYPAGAAPYRISTNVQRFESVPGQYALVDATWSVRQVGSETVLTCRSVLREPVGQGYDALVAGHRAALAKLGKAMAAAVRKGSGGGC
ncbi:PqiC family protein [Massilia phyllosphaerae]|uniref:PqiC family protein n=1 Tax=Massilia phyllosphaerae TaxID=3106034 RepID=UPI002B1CACD7|nr:PqiC family protein [Massilia sp. SGZ-792]